VNFAVRVTRTPAVHDEVAIDVLGGNGRSDSVGASAMQSEWVARVYETWWRPALFAASTGLRAPSAEDEARLVARRIAACPGPWLDLSCGPGGLTRRLACGAAGRTVVGVDTSRAMLRRARAVAPAAMLVRADAADLPFETGTFGAVANLAALDLYPDARRVIAEAARVLAAGGRWVCSTFVASRAGRRSWLSSVAGVRTPTLDDIAAWTEEAGLVALDVTEFGRYVIVGADKA
jgi:SAM-dependent methyltransferase